MKKLFVPLISKHEIGISELNKISNILPKNIALVYTIQYLNLAEKLKKELSKKHKILSFSQILGCNYPNFSNEIDAVLLVSDGKFHAVSLAYETKRPIYLLERGKLIKISGDEIISFEKKRKAIYLKFLNSEKAGVLISTKPGQQRLKQALALKKKLKNKKLYFFISNDIDLRETENFGLGSWINTTCPRLDMNGNVINITRL